MSTRSEILLWADGVPGVDAEDQPSITACPSMPEIANGAAVLVCPGGGYSFLSNEYEGRFPAEWLNSLGVAAFILNYRIAPKFGHPAPMQDVLRAMRTIRARAGEFGIDPNRIGAWGFSAGAHLAATAGTHFDAGDPTSADPIEGVSSRPDFMILSYPVITMDSSFTHMGSREALLGVNPDDALVEFMSLEKQVKPNTPPTFLFHTDEDPAVPSENSVAFYTALRAQKIPSEMHIYEKGRHGVNLAQFDKVLDNWPELLKRWLRSRSLI